jgi:hypothetical protein
MDGHQAIVGKWVFEPKFDLYFFLRIQMKIVALAGGVGGAKLAHGLAHTVTRHLCRNTQSFYK